MALNERDAYSRQTDKDSLTLIPAWIDYHIPGKVKIHTTICKIQSLSKEMDKYVTGVGV